jgi:pSer/pThr/pTyr-binding forkhead associated (FHA) protein
MKEIIVQFTPVQKSFEHVRSIALINDGEPISLGRTSGNFESKADNLLFTSRVVSRKHAEVYIKNEKV